MDAYKFPLFAVLALLALMALPALAEEEVTAKNIKYKSGKEVDFEELLIQGRLKRPEITVVTGDASDGTDGLLRLRENFLDRMSVDMGEEVK